MADTVIGIFRDNKQAGNAVSEFVNKGFTNDITVVAKEGVMGDTNVHEVKKDVTEGTTTGAVAGATVGGLAALLSGVASFVVPGVGLLVYGPLATFLGGLAAGALTGGLMGALVDYGIPEEKAKVYQQRLEAGEVLVGVSTGNMTSDDAQMVLKKHGANEIEVIQPKM
jgi:uncharacterized membrane protein